MAVASYFIAQFPDEEIIKDQEGIREKNAEEIVIFTLDMTMMGTTDAWKNHSSSIGATGLISKAMAAVAQTRKESAATVLPLRPPDFAFFPNSHREHFKISFVYLYINNTVPLADPEP